MPGPTRRSTLTGLAGTVAAGMVSRTAGADAAPPNVVWILVDDLRWNWLGCMGHPWIPTPNIDRIAARGVVFDNAFVAISICSPSRATMLTGCHPQRTGVFLNSSQDIRPEVPSWAQVLQGAGYETALVGKWHMRPYNRARAGWDKWFSFRGQGSYEDPEFFDGQSFFQKPGYMTDLLTDQAVEWIETRSGEKPFAMLVSHKGVHGAPVPAPRHREAFPTEQFPEPVSWTDDLADKPEYQRARVVWGSRKDQWERALAEGQSVPASIEARPWRPRLPQHLDTARCLLSVDDSVGRILDALEAKGRAEDTLVIFTSDNGVMLGEHAFLPGGKQLLYEESVRVPLILAGPGVAQGRRCDAFTSVLDLAPTLFDLGGAKEPPPVHGRSLLPLLARPGNVPRDWREHLLFQHFLDERWPSRPHMHGVRTHGHKLVVAPEHEDGVELYDLKEDPHELVNLALSSEHAGKRQELEALLAAELAALE